MRRQLISAAAVLALVLGAAPAAAEPARVTATTASEELTETIDAILADPGLSGAQAAVAVADTGTGELLYERDPHDRLMPASNTKLLTSAAAMEILGPEYRFDTQVLATGERRGRVLRGDLYLRGTGDPTMLAEDYQALAGQVAASGVRVVTGDLVADDTWFDRVRLGREWAWEDEPYYYAAQVSALSVAPDTDYDAGTVIVTVSPGAAPGDPVEVALTPPTSYLTIDNRATTTGPGEGGVSIEREHGGNRLVVAGELPVDAGPVRAWRSVWEPTGYAADVFRTALADHGVEVRGGPRLGVPTPDNARRLASHRSMPLAELLVPFLKLSNNGHAEVLTKAIGRAVSDQGSWPAGLAAINSYLDEQGMAVDSQRQADGSGLSRWNLVPAGEFVKLLSALPAAEWFEVWYESLPIAGESDRLVGGTLRSRMRDTAAQGNAHAKTGTLTSVSALSGYVTDTDGRQLSFAILLNHHFGSVKHVEDRIVVALAEFSTSAPRSGPGLTAPPVTPELPADLECSWVKPAGC